MDAPLDHFAAKWGLRKLASFVRVGNPDLQASRAESVPCQSPEAPQGANSLDCYGRNAAREHNNEMPSLEMNRLAAEVTELWVDFQEALSSEKRKYPIQQFQTFWLAAKRYAELANSDPLLHRSVAVAVNGLVDFIGAERKRIPGSVLRDAERLECLLFCGYDPYFEGDEPPGL